MEIIQRLVALMVENDLAEVAIRDGEEEITLKRGGLNAAHPVTAPAALAASPVGPGAAPSEPAAIEDPNAGLTPIASPMVGTFYTSPDPASPPFVKGGDHVTPDTVVCIIEAMKVFNEIKAGVTGIIRRVMAGNETAVEYGQPLFMVKAD